MQIYFIFSLLFAVVVALFAVLNSGIVEISYFFGKTIPVAQSVVILISAAFGALIMGLFAIFSKFKSGLKNRKQNSRINALEKEIEKYKEAEKKAAESMMKKEEEAARQLEAAKEKIGEDAVKNEK